MKKKRIVISGSPGAGKTTLVEELKKLGYPTFDEYSRTLIKAAKKEGKNQYYKFSSKVQVKKPNHIEISKPDHAKTGNLSQWP